MSAPAAGIDVFAEVTGDPSTGPALVFANAIGTNLRIWDAVVEHLRWPGAVIRYDKRGHGRSEVPPPPYTLDDHVADLARLLARHDAAPAIVCGLSVGGLIAQGLALGHPDTVRALILCDTSPKVGTPEMWHDRIAAITADGLDAHADAILARWFSQPWRDAHADKLDHWRATLLATPVAGYIGTCAALAAADLRAAVAGITAPALMLGGSADVATPPEAMRDFAAMLPNARFEPIAGAGHLPCIEQPAAMAAAIDAFITPFTLQPDAPQLDGGH